MKPFDANRRTQHADGSHHWRLLTIAALLGLLLPIAWRWVSSDRSVVTPAWLPTHFDALADLGWLGQQAGGTELVVVSWDGCQLASDERLPLLAERLRNVTLKNSGERLFAKVLTGADVVARLTKPPTRLSRAAAIDWVSGAFVGPLPIGAPPSTDAQPTCLVAYWQPDTELGTHQPAAVAQQIVAIATRDCGLAAASVRYAGPNLPLTVVPAPAAPLPRFGLGMSILLGMALTFIYLYTKQLTVPLSQWLEPRLTPAAPPRVIREVEAEPVFSAEFVSFIDQEPAADLTLPDSDELDAPPPVVRPSAKPATVRIDRPAAFETELRPAHAALRDKLRLLGQR